MTFGNKISELNLIKLDLFKAQDPETGLYDVTFEIEGKLLYAHKPMLTLVSDTFTSMLSDRWATKDEAIKIKDYSYDDFYQFITFLYSAQCTLTDTNIYAMVDMAEFYGVKIFKDYCDEYLAAMEITNKNIFKLLELADKYSMKQLKKTIRRFITNNFESFSDSDEFLIANKYFIKQMVVAFKNRIKPEDMFQAVYKWCEKQATDKKTVIQNMNLKKAIKDEIFDLLPFIQFHRMNIKFMIEFLVPRGFIFSSLDELSKVLGVGVTKPNVKITNVNGQTLNGSIYDKTVIKNIKSLKASTCFYGCDINCWWIKPFNLPSTPSPLKKRNGVEWYLSYYSSGFIGVKHCSCIDNGSYLLAELSSGTSGFDTASGCKIEIECFK